MNYYAQIIAEIEDLYPNIGIKKVSGDCVSSYQTLVEVSQEIFDSLESDMSFCNCEIASHLNADNPSYYLKFINNQLPYIGLVIFKPTLESGYIITKL